MRNIFNRVKRGFTLVELLVVIGVIGVLAAGLVAVINPADRVAAANDAKVIADMNQLAGALQAYAASNGGSYPVIAGGTGANWNTVVAAVPNELSVTSIPGAATYSYGWSCSTTSCKLSVQQKSKKAIGANPAAYVCWTSAGGVTSASGTVAAMAPTNGVGCP